MRNFENVLRARNRLPLFLALSGWAGLEGGQALRADPIRYLGGTTVLTKAELSVSPEVIPQVIGTLVTLTAKANGVLIAGITISFYADEKLIGTAPTDQASTATLQFDTASLGEGPHTFRAEFPLTITAIRPTAKHVMIFENNVFAGYFDLFARDYATSSTAQLSQHFLKSVVLSAPHAKPDGSFQFSFEAKADWDYLVEVSTNMTDWSALSSLTQPHEDGPSTVVDTEAAKSPLRSYRVSIRQPTAETKEPTGASERLKPAGTGKQ